MSMTPEQVAQDGIEFVDAIEKLALSIPAPNPFTPQFVQLCIAARDLKNQCQQTAISQPAADQQGVPSENAALGEMIADVLRTGTGIVRISPEDFYATPPVSRNEVLEALIRGVDEAVQDTFASGRPAAHLDSAWGRLQDALKGAVPPADKGADVPSDAEIERLQAVYRKEYDRQRKLDVGEIEAEHQAMRALVMVISRAAPSLPVDQQAAPAGEPVAWLHAHNGRAFLFAIPMDKKLAEARMAEGIEVMPVYAAPPAQAAAPSGYKLLKDTTQEERSWPEDFHLENGNYFNNCTQCLRVFTGYKGRIICHVCNAAPAQGSAPDREGK